MKRHLKYICIVVLLFGSGASNGLMDALQFHHAWQHFDKTEFWNPALSWENKWARNEGGTVMVGTERFWGSSRWFVALTDGWHLAKFFQILLLKAAVLLALFWPAKPLSTKLINVILFFIGTTIVVSSGFHTVYILIF